MTPNEALQILDQVISQVSANREVHKKLEEAMMVLSNFITEKSK